MKEKIQYIVQRVPRDKKSLLFIGVALIIIVAVPTAYALTSIDQKANVEGQTMASEEDAVDSRIAIVGEESTIGTGNVGPSNSWPGEIVSSEISQIQPQREGVIVEWRVRVGQQVSVGQILGKISAPPATPELIQMLAEQTESVTMARAGASIADEYTSKEQARLGALRDSIDNSTGASADLSFTALKSLREKVEVKKQALRTFVERALATHVATVTNFSDWRYVQYGISAGYGSYSQNVRNAYQTSLVTFVDILKRTEDLPIDTAANYFDLAVRVANNTPGDTVGDFKTMTATDQKDFLDFVAEYKEAQMEVADKETEYKIMINEKVAMLEKDRSMAYAGAQAAEVAYKTVAGQINGGVYIYAPRSGSISAIYKKVGDLVTPMMSVAVVAGHGNKDLIVRMRIPSNIRKPLVGDIVSVVRPGFPKDAHKAKMLGVGISLDETGSYMADAVLLDHVDWPVEASVRVIALDNTNTPTVPLTSVWWYGEGIPHVWGVSDAGRIFSKKVTLGRTLGVSVEVYEGLKKGDRYIVRPTSDMYEDMLLQDLGQDADGTAKTKAPDGEDSMGGMEM
jgi:multidrug efflux pump subunit AcrA (membrane-fusion protein)